MLASAVESWGIWPKDVIEPGTRTNVDVKNPLYLPPLLPKSPRLQTPTYLPNHHPLT